MAYDELVDALRREGAAKIAAIRAEAEMRAEELRREGATTIAALREERGRAAAEASRRHRDKILGTARDDARLILAAAQQALAGRLFAAALAALAGLRFGGYGDPFTALAAELPDALWEEIIVNPADRDTAARLFPRSKIATDARITGGLEAITGNGRVRVVNTLDARLRRAWPELLPGILEALRGNS